MRKKRKRKVENGRTSKNIRIMIFYKMDKFYFALLETNLAIACTIEQRNCQNIQTFKHVFISSKLV